MTNGTKTRPVVSNDHPAAIWTDETTWALAFCMAENMELIRITHSTLGKKVVLIISQIERTAKPHSVRTLNIPKLVTLVRAP